MDLVQSEYGWDDAYVLDLTIARLRQIIEIIKDRRRTEFLISARLTEWSTRTIAQFVAGTTGSEGKSLQSEANKIRLDLDAESDTDASGSIDDYDYVEHGSRTAASRNQFGSAERLMSGFGNQG